MCERDITLTLRSHCMRHAKDLVGVIITQDCSPNAELASNRAYFCVVRRSTNENIKKILIHLVEKLLLHRHELCSISIQVANTPREMQDAGRSLGRYKVLRMNGQYGQTCSNVSYHFTQSSSPPSLLKDRDTRRSNITGLLQSVKAVMLRK